MKDPYQILGVERDANHAQIKSAYKEQALKYHPDQSGSEDTVDKFREVQEAYEILGDEKKRADYDYSSYSPASARSYEAEAAEDVDLSEAEVYKTPDFAQEQEVFEGFYQKFSDYIENLAQKRFLSMRKTWTKKDKDGDKYSRLERLRHSFASSLDNEIKLMEIQKEYLCALYEFKVSIDDTQDFNPYFWLKEIPSNLNYYDGRIRYYRSRLNGGS